jgi:hypothetical protein
MGMRNVVLLTVALIIITACNERILPPPLDGGDGGAGGEAAPATPAPTASPEADCKGGLKCSGQWRR